ncbi:hypothetical protein KOW79_022495 [Hemibagrus wyckioides]|uniref:Uncharacterized protein n=1 Tax=Hemibagrus wyckioides TaxID=337641 RepID=A0A9D3SCS9_9TELE|nr:hypothetical protein KOW79_022495 [Hemibagrus wyckioides]
MNGGRAAAAAAAVSTQSTGALLTTQSELKIQGRAAAGAPGVQLCAQPMREADGAPRSRLAKRCTPDYTIPGEVYIQKSDPISIKDHKLKTNSEQNRSQERVNLCKYYK